MPQIYRHSDSRNSSTVGTRRRTPRKTVAEDNAAPAALNGAKESVRSVPGWRRIEALKERRALKEALTDIWSEDPELDDDIFFPDAESVAYYRQNGVGTDDEVGEVIIDPDDVE